MGKYCSYTGKIKFESRSQAEQVLAFEGVRFQHVYHCTHCKSWHSGHEGYSEKRKVKKRYRVRVTMAP